MRFWRPSTCLVQNAFDICDCSRFGKLALIKLHLITLLKNREQVHAIHTDDHAIVDRRLCAKRSFEVLGIDIHPLSGDDYVLLTPFEIEIAGLVQGTQVACAKPVALVRGNRLAIHPIGLRDTVATDKDLARFVEFDLASGQGFAYRSATELEGMIQAH